jgi:ribosomal protein L37E
MENGMDDRNTLCCQQCGSDQFFHREQAGMAGNKPAVVSRITAREAYYREDWVFIRCHRCGMAVMLVAKEETTSCS